MSAGKEHQQRSEAANSQDTAPHPGPSQSDGVATENPKSLKSANEQDQAKNGDEGKGKGTGGEGLPATASSSLSSSFAHGIDSITIRVPSDKPGTAKFSVLIGTGTGDPLGPFSRPGQSHPDPHMPDVPASPYFRYAKATRPALEARLLEPGAPPRAPIPLQLQRGFAELTPEERRFWDDDYAAALRLYAARVHAYREAGDRDAWRMTDGEADAWAAAHGISHSSNGGGGRMIEPNLPVSPAWPYYLWAKTVSGSIKQEVEAEIENEPAGVDPAAWGEMSNGNKALWTRSLMERESMRRWEGMSEEERNVWREEYRANMRLYEARVHAYKVGGRADAKQMTDEEAGEWADGHGIEMPPLRRICRG